VRRQTKEEKWLDDAEKELETVINIGTRGKSKRRGEARLEARKGLKLQPLGKGDEKADTEKAVQDAEAGLQFAEDEWGEESRESAVALDNAAIAYIRARKLQLAELCSQQAHHLYDTHDGPNADTTVMAMMRVIHVFSLEGKWRQVDVACDKAILMVTQASVLTKQMRQLADQIAVLARIKCKLDRGGNSKLGRLTGASNKGAAAT